MSESCVYSIKMNWVKIILNTQASILNESEFQFQHLAILLVYFVEVKLSDNLDFIIKPSYLCLII